MKRSIAISGIAAVQALVLGGLLLSGGCRNTEVMNNRPYLPAAAGDEVTGTPLAETAPVETPVLEPAPAATTAKSRYSDLPSFDEATSSVPVRSTATVSGKKAAPGGTYVVQRGDTISHIALRHGVSVGAMLSANNLTQASAKRIRIGQKLTIPGGATAKKAVRKSAAKSNGKTVAAAPAAVAADGMYVVQAGDNIPKIARKLGVKQSELKAINNLTDEATRRLQIGQKLAVPGKSAGAVAATAPAAAADTKTREAIDDLGAVLNTTAPTAETPAPAPEAPATTAATDVQPETISGATKPVEITSDIKIDDFVKQHNLSVDAFKKLNAEVIPAGDDTLKANTIVFVPSAD